MAAAILQVTGFALQEEHPLQSGAERASVLEIAMHALFADSVGSEWLRAVCEQTGYSFADLETVWGSEEGLRVAATRYAMTLALG